MTDKKKAYYVDNTKFATAVIEYVEKRKLARLNGTEEPRVTNYIADCFNKIATGLSFNKQFISNHHIRDEMILDAMEDCLKAVMNYDHTASTQSGKPNPFGYFTRCCYNAFLRRIEKEKKQERIKNKIIESASHEFFIQSAVNGSAAEAVAALEEMRNTRARYRNRG